MTFVKREPPRHKVHVRDLPPDFDVVALPGNSDIILQWKTR